MYAIEFESTIENSIIKVPVNHLAKLAGKIKVIILTEKAEKTTLKQKKPVTLLMNY